jgi:hypothetical protein
MAVLLKKQVFWVITLCCWASRWAVFPLGWKNVTFETSGTTDQIIQCHIPEDPSPQPLVIQPTQTTYLHFLFSTKSTTYRNISNLFMTLWILAQIFMKNSIDFHVFIVLFIISLLGKIFHVPLAHWLWRWGLFCSTFPSAPVLFYLMMVNMYDRNI